MTMTDDQVQALLDEMTREVICCELDKALAERIGRALLDARAKLADWIVRADEANVKVETLEAELARVKTDAAVAVALVAEKAVEAMKTAGDSAVTEALGQRLCCNVQDCGCQGATVEQYLEYLIRDLAPADGLAMVQELRAEMDTLAAENASLKAAKAVAG